MSRPWYSVVTALVYKRSAPLVTRVDGAIGGSAGRWRRQHLRRHSHVEQAVRCGMAFWKCAHCECRSHLVPIVAGAQT